MARLVPAKRSAPILALCGWLAICAACSLVAAGPGLAQTQAPSPQLAPDSATPQPQSPQPLQEPAEQPAPPQKPDGFLDALGRWFDKSRQDLKESVDKNNERWRSAVEENNARWKAGVDENNARWRELHERTEKAAKDAAAAQKEAADAFKSLTNTRIVEGRQVCEPAPNGSPDCQAAAEVICKGKGFATGKSADITTTRKCSARALIQRDSSECRTETVVIKAACQ